MKLHLLIGIVSTCVFGYPGQDAKPSATPNSDASSSNPTDSSVCLSLKQSTLCQPWSSGFVNVSSSWSVATFDTALRIWADSPQHVSNFNQVYNCNWNGSGLRYVLTYGCAERIYSSDIGCNVDHGVNITGITLSPSVLSSNLSPMCYSTCTTYFNSLGGLFKDPDVCVQPANDGSTPDFIDSRSKTLSYIQTFCQDSTSNDTSSCINANPVEATSCGFGFHVDPDVSNYCSSNPSDPCCSQISLSLIANAKPMPESTIALIAILSCIGFISLCVVCVFLWFIYTGKTIPFMKRRVVSAPEEVVKLIRISSRFSRTDSMALKSPSSPTPKTSAAFPRSTPTTSEAPLDALIDHGKSSDDLNDQSLIKPHTVIFQYEKNLSDEIDLNHGDEVLIKEIFNDGWVRGINLSTGSTGTFPAACISPKG